MLRIWSGWAPLLLSISDRNIEEGEQASTPITSEDSTPQVNDEHSNEEVREQSKVVIRPRGITYSGMAQIGKNYVFEITFVLLMFVSDEIFPSISFTIKLFLSSQASA